MIRWADAGMTALEEFERRYGDPAPGLLLKNWGETTLPFFGIPVQHRRGTPASADAVSTLVRMIANGPSMALRSFFERQDGVELCVHPSGCRGNEMPLLRLHPIDEWEFLTARFQTSGDYAWTIEHNRYRGVAPLYHSDDRWLAFATVDELPACLTIFVSGPNAGRIFFLAPEPDFNIAKPIAGTFERLLSLLAGDMAAVFRRLGVQVSVASGDGGFAHFVPSKYVRDCRSEPGFRGESPFT